MALALAWQALFEGGAAFPVGFSAISAVATCTVVVPVFLFDRTQWAVPKRDYMPGAPKPWRPGFRVGVKVGVGVGVGVEG